MFGHRSAHGSQKALAQIPLRGQFALWLMDTRGWHHHLETSVQHGSGDGDLHWCSQDIQSAVDSSLLGRTAAALLRYLGTYILCQRQSSVTYRKENWTLRMAGHWWQPPPPTSYEQCNWCHCVVLFISWSFAGKIACLFSMSLQPSQLWDGAENWRIFEQELEILGLHLYTILLALKQ